MDKKLTFTQSVLDRVTSDFDRLKAEKENISFVTWTEIPENFQNSYYENEQLINPLQETFEQWQAKLSKRPNPLYSVALIGNDIVSSVYGAELNSERTMNLWATNSSHRQNGLGKIVLLNFIKHSFTSNSEIPIKAWDITSQQVDKVLTSLGFQ